LALRFSSNPVSQMRITVLFVTCALFAAVVAEAGQTPQRSAVAAGAATDAPPPPIAPATINRDASGRATVRAVRVSPPPRIDGKLDESIYSEVQPVSDFIQNDPKEGAPATEKTEVWVLFDDKNFYVVARCWESHPEALVANEMRRDNTNIVYNDQF